MIKRYSTKYLEAALSGKVGHNVILVEGARQVGKTCLIQQFLAKHENSISINLEDDREFCLLCNQCKSFSDFELLLKRRTHLDLHKQQILFIDEAQESYSIGGFIRFMKEKWPHTRVILTGSSMSRLFRKEERVPVGRFVRYLIMPFSFREFLLACNETALLEALENFNPHKPFSEVLHGQFLKRLDDYITCGGLPEVVTTFAADGDWRRVRNSVLLSQADDFLRKSDFEDDAHFLDALRGVANNLGFPSKTSHIGGDNKTASKLLALLRDWLLVFEVEQKGVNSTTSFFPKRYLYDIGIAQQVRNMPFPPLSIAQTGSPVLRTQLGGVFENLVLCELIASQAEYAGLSGWKKNASDGVEVDFVWNVGNATPIEAKATRKVSYRNFSSLKSWLELSGKKIGVLVSSAPFAVLKKADLTFINIPLYLFDGKMLPGIIEALS